MSQFTCLILGVFVENQGCEFYFGECHPSLVGCSMREASLKLRGAVLVGLKRGPDIMLNPESNLPQSVGTRARRGSGAGRDSGGSRGAFASNGSGSGSGGHQGRDSGGHGRDDAPRIVFEENDEIIVIAEDDSSYSVGGATCVHARSSRCSCLCWRQCW